MRDLEKRKTIGRGERKLAKIIDYFGAEAAEPEQREREKTRDCFRKGRRRAVCGHSKIREKDQK